MEAWVTQTPTDSADNDGVGEGCREVLLGDFVGKYRFLFAANFSPETNVVVKC